MVINPKYNWLHEAKTNNTWKTVLLLFLFPLIIFWLCYWITYLVYSNQKPNLIEATENIQKEYDYLDEIDIVEWQVISDSYKNNIEEELEKYYSWKDLSIEEKLALYKQDKLKEKEAKLNEIKNTPIANNIVIDDLEVLYSSIQIFSIFFCFSLLWLLISFLFQKELFFAYSWAKPLNRKENPMIYNIVENLCMSKGLAMPKIWIINESWLNAFAIGWNPKNSWIVFTKWLIEKLNKEEIEAVAWHELTHIINKDTLMNVIVILWIGIISTIGYWILRIGSSMKSDKKSGNAQLVIILIGLSLLLVSWLIFPLIRLAISRKREYLADAWSAELTKNPNALISALQKISNMPDINNNSADNMSSMYIFEPKDKWLSSHPSLENRIAALKSYTL